MSILSMSRLAEGDSAEPDSTLQSSLRLVAVYVPSEALAAYVVLLGLLSPLPTAPQQDVYLVRLITFVIGVLICLALPLIAFKGGNLTRREQRRRQVIVAAMAAITFAFYAAAMPSFFLQTTALSIPLSQWASVLAIAATLIMPTIARLASVRR